jgi:phosphate transport system substrate-binding protein
MKKTMVWTLVFFMLMLVLSACGADNASEDSSELSGKITINGSSAMLPLMLQAQDDFKQKHPKVKVSASGTSSIVGPQSVEKNSADIGTCDWDATTDVPGFDKFEGQISHKIAAIPFATVVHKDNPVQNLTKQQLIDIFQGKVKNWKEVGGADKPLVVINRAFGSGTRVNYQAKALGGADFMVKGDNYKEVKSSGEMATAIKSEPNAIGYLDLVYVKDELKSVGYEGVEATVENVTNGQYPVWGYAYMLTKGEPKGATKAFIEYVQSEEFQSTAVKEMNFIAVSEIKE